MKIISSYYIIHFLILWHWISIHILISVNIIKINLSF